jgi:hypothetical protein
MQADVLHRRPDNAETAGLGRKGVNLISTLPHIAEETFDGIGGLNVLMHRLRKGKEGQGVLFVLGQTSHRFWIAFAVLGFETGQVSHGFLLARLAPDAVEFRLHLASFSPGNSAEDIAPLMRLASVDEAWPQRVPRPQPAVHRDRQ